MSDKKSQHADKTDSQPASTTVNSVPHADQKQEMDTPTGHPFPETTKNAGPMMMRFPETTKNAAPTTYIGVSQLGEKTENRGAPVFVSQSMGEASSINGGMQGQESPKGSINASKAKEYYDHNFSNPSSSPMQDLA